MLKNSLSREVFIQIGSMNFSLFGLGGADIFCRQGLLSCSGFTMNFTLPYSTSRIYCSTCGSTYPTSKLTMVHTLLRLISIHCQVPLPPRLEGGRGSRLSAKLHEVLRKTDPARISLSRGHSFLLSRKVSPLPSHPSHPDCILALRHQPRALHPRRAHVERSSIAALSTRCTWSTPTAPITTRLCTASAPATSKRRQPAEHQQLRTPLPWLRRLPASSAPASPAASPSAASPFGVVSFRR